MSEKVKNEPVIDPDEILEGVLRWVDIESPSHDRDAVNNMVDCVEGSVKNLGLLVDRKLGRDGFGDILSARTPWGGEQPGILILSHLDTVHPLGTKDALLKIRREGDKVFGPGIYDMKAGAYIAFYAMRHIIRKNEKTPLPVTLMYIPEEEVGSPTSRDLIVEAAKKKQICFSDRTGARRWQDRNRPEWQVAVYCKSYWSAVPRGVTPYGRAECYKGNG